MNSSEFSTLAVTDSAAFTREQIRSGKWAPGDTDCDLCAGVPPAWVYQRGACQVFGTDGVADLPPGPWMLCAQCADDVENKRWPTLAFRMVDAIADPPPSAEERQRLAEDVSWLIFMWGMRRNDGGPRQPWRTA